MQQREFENEILTMEQAAACVAELYRKEIEFAKRSGFSSHLTVRLECDIHNGQLAMVRSEAVHKTAFFRKNGKKE